MSEFANSYGDDMSQVRNTIIRGKNVIEVLKKKDL